MAMYHMGSFLEGKEVLEIHVKHSFKVGGGKSIS
jgi:hypothetical protein